MLTIPQHRFTAYADDFTTYNRCAKTGTWRPTSGSATPCSTWPSPSLPSTSALRTPPTNPKTHTSNLQPYALHQKLLNPNLRTPDLQPYARHRKLLNPKSQNRKPNPKPKPPNSKPQIGIREPRTQNQTQNTSPQILNFKLKTANRKPGWRRCSGRRSRAPTTRTRSTPNLTAHSPQTLNPEPSTLHLNSPDPKPPFRLPTTRNQIPRTHDKDSVNPEPHTPTLYTLNPGFYKDTATTTRTRSTPWTVNSQPHTPHPNFPHPKHQISFSCTHDKDSVHPLHCNRDTTLIRNCP
jgi:hypothetical protein